MHTWEGVARYIYETGTARKDDPSWSSHEYTGLSNNLLCLHIHGCKAPRSEGASSCYSSLFSVRRITSKLSVLLFWNHLWVLNDCIHLQHPSTFFYIVTVSDNLGINFLVCLWQNMPWNNETNQSTTKRRSQFRVKVLMLFLKEHNIDNFQVCLGGASQNMKWWCVRISTFKWQSCFIREKRQEATNKVRTSNSPIIF